MRNLKKILALVLAMVMAFSVMATANAFTDDADITGTYDEAVEVLAGLKVFEGYEDGSFQPQGKITRAEVAAIIYRIVTGDVDDKQVGIYADYNKFDDVKSTAWYAGYVNFCANAEYILGYGDGKFGPDDNVTGYQALAMILRAIGYDKNGEFTGAEWQVQTAAVGKKLGVTNNVTAGTLGTAATREVVAEILFQTIAYATQVDYTVAFGYTTIGNNTLGYDTFKLTKGERTIIDNWGRPGYVWTAYAAQKTIATIEEAYKYATNVQVAECDVAKALGLTKDTAYAVYDNDVDPLAAKTTINLVTTDKIGAQGQIVEVYADRIVKIDTLLAKVTDVDAATFDANGHLATASKIELLVYEANGATDTVYDTNGKTNYPYAVGDYVLINAHLNQDADRTVAHNWLDTADYLDIISVASSIEGTQTVIWFQAGQHTVNGTTYDDAYRFHLNNVNMTNTANRTWFFDQFGNLIGNIEIATAYSYAAIKNMWWSGDAATGLGVAKATLVYMDGTENVVTVSGIKLNTDASYVAPVYSAANTTNASDMLYVAATTAAAGNLFVASYAPTNAAAVENGKNGVITTANAVADQGNLFRVETKADGTVRLSEVDKELTAAHIYNKYAPISGTGDVALTGAQTILMNSNTQYLIYNNTTKTFTAGSDFNTIPNFKNNSAVVDYVDANGDGYAEYLYIIGTPDSTVTYNFVMPQSINYSAELKTAGGINYYVVTIVNIDGTQTTLKVKTTNKTDVLDVLVSAINTNKLYYVTFTGDYATGLDEVTGIAHNWTGMGANDRVHKLADDGTTTNSITRTGNNLRIKQAGGWDISFNVTEATEIVGTLPEGRQTGKIVYVLNGEMNVATKIWVVDGSLASSTIKAATLNTVQVDKPIAAYGATVPTTAAITALTNHDLVNLVTYGTDAATAVVNATKVTLTWQKMDANGNFQPYEGTAFAEGVYRPVYTVSTTAKTAAGQPYTLLSGMTLNGQATTAGVLVGGNQIVKP